MPAAQAMDYVKCEAMQKALERITNSRDRGSSEIWKRNLKEMRVKNCGPEPSALDAGYSLDKKFAWYDCTKAAYKREYDNLKMAQQAELASLEATARKVQADYDAAGCY